MFCKYAWSREFIDATLSPNFRQKDYRLHRENVLCDREKSKLPETQAILETVKERESALSKDIEELSKEQKSLALELESINANYRSRIDNINQILHEKRRRMLALYQVLDGELDDLPDDSTFKKDTLKKVSSLRFPCGKDDCKGMLSSDFNCNICGGSMCKDCHEMLPDEPFKDHQCKKEILENVRQLCSDSRNCPGCSSFIYKIDGCDQMWCTRCRTAFSWNTGVKISSGQIHNPHFFEWKRDNGGLAPGAVDTYGCPLDKDEMLSGIRRNVAYAIGIAAKDVPLALGETYLEVLALRNKESTSDEQKLDPMRSLRIEYLTGRISEVEWKKQLQKEEKKQMKKFETGQVIDMYVTTMMDIFRQIYVAKKDKQAVKENLSLAVSVMKYVYTQLVTINTRYQSGAAPQAAVHATKLEKFIEQDRTKSTYKEKQRTSTINTLNVVEPFDTKGRSGRNLE